MSPACAISQPSPCTSRWRPNFREAGCAGGDRRRLCRLFPAGESVLAGLSTIWMQRSRLQVPAARLPSWRLVAAAFLHFGIVAYLIVVIPLSMVLVPAHGTIEDMMRLSLRLSALFLVVYLMLGGTAVGIAAIIDGRARRASQRVTSMEPSLARSRVAGAIMMANGGFDSASQTTIEQIAARVWVYEDDRYQALARDLDMVVRRALAAQAEASDGVAPQTSAASAMSLVLIDQALVALEHDRASAAATDVRAAALYIQQRYGSSDFAIKPD